METPATVGLGLPQLGLWAAGRAGFRAGREGSSVNWPLPDTRRWGQMPVSTGTTELGFDGETLSLKVEGY